MAEFKANVDFGEWTTLFDRLQGAARESLARRMLVSGGKVLEAEAKMLARRPTTHVYNPASRGSQEAGQLADAIYLAFRDGESTQTTFKYSVSWNNQKAWWGKLREFGYYVRYPYYIDKHGMYHTYHAEGGKGKGTPLPKPHWVAPTPFLGPALNVLPQVKIAMIERGREEVQKLLKGGL